MGQTEYKQFCQNICYLRQKNKINKKQMASIMHVSPCTLERIEAGEIPDKLLVDVFERLAICFDLHIADLFAPTEEFIKIAKGERNEGNQHRSVLPEPALSTPQISSECVGDGADAGDQHRCGSTD